MFILHAIQSHYNHARSSGSPHFTYSHATIIILPYNDDNTVQKHISHRAMRALHAQACDVNSQFSFIRPASPYAFSRIIFPFGCLFSQLSGTTHLIDYSITIIHF